MSHLFYVYDVIFLGEWKRSNIVNIVQVLHCFYMIYGLKINLHKSNLYEVCVLVEEVDDFAYVMGCRVDKLTFTYMGLSVGQNMTRVVGWKVIDRFQKLCVLNFFGGGDEDTRKIS